ncbi:MAG: hypothetical protein EOP24_42130 [Hyphomicrobiales bacterium]|nr:MAG: hypothetical protein EOP24_42130 [Hyphomicrobiales bacterium]
MNKYESLVFRGARFGIAALVGLTCALLVGCGPEAPPCNDPESLQSVLSMVRQAHDDRLKGLPYTASTELATFELDAVAPTAYDDKLKMRSCTAVFVTTLSPKAADASTKYIQAMTGPLMNRARSFTIFGQSPSPLTEDAQQDLLQIQIMNPGPVRLDPIRKSIVYRIQKQEGGSAFMVIANVEVAQTAPYLRVASRAQKLVEDATVQKAKETAEKAQRDAEVERLSASGTWRKVVYIKSFAETASSAGRCLERGLYCFEGFDGKNQMDSVYYQLDRKKFDDRNRQAMDVAYRNNQPVCLVNVRKTASPDVFSAEGFSTFRNDKGEAVDCLPGAEKQNWAETLSKGGAPAPAATAPPAEQAAATPAAATAVGPAAAPLPANLESLIVRYERCGEEAVCLHTAKGNTIYIQASQLRHADFAMLDAAKKGRSTVCLKEVVRTEGKSFTAESLDSRC